MKFRSRKMAGVGVLLLSLASVGISATSASATTYAIDCSVDPATYAGADPATYVQNPYDPTQYIWYVEYSGLQMQSPTVSISNCLFNASSSADGSWWSSGSPSVSVDVNEWADVQGYGIPGQTKYKIVFYNYSYQPEFSREIVYEGESSVLTTNSPFFQWGALYRDGDGLAPFDFGLSGLADGIAFDWDNFGGSEEVTLTFRIYDCEYQYDIDCDEPSETLFDFSDPFLGEATVTFAAAGSEASVDLDPVPYLGPLVNNDPQTATSGSTVTYTGTDLDDVTSATIAGVSSTIVSKSPSTLTLRVPTGLALGQHDVDLYYSTTEVLTLQNGLVIQDPMKVWTQLQTDNTVKMYAKNIIGEGKIQFFHNGNEIAWVRASNALNPKLREANGSHYLVRTRELVAGKNAFEIYDDGTRIWRAAYAG